jgi:hypothetical protein
VGNEIGGDDLAARTDDVLAAGKGAAQGPMTWVVMTQDHHLFLSIKFLSDEGAAFTTDLDDAGKFSTLESAIHMCGRSNERYSLPDHFQLEVVPTAKVVQERKERERLLYLCQVEYLLVTGRIQPDDVADHRMLTKHLLNQGE